ncbi:MAG: hypothetical protein HY810_01115 [Candidatus Omnitrophica bacterium]|nr:hypothetical protein [Candidatus Omnitrophota bacterium]
MFKHSPGNKEITAALIFKFSKLFDSSKEAFIEAETLRKTLSSILFE